MEQMLFSLPNNDGSWKDHYVNCLTHAAYEKSSKLLRPKRNDKNA